MHLVKSFHRFFSLTVVYNKVLILSERNTFRNVYLKPIYLQKVSLITMSQRSITSFFSKAGKKAVEAVEQPKSQEPTKRQRADSSGSEGNLEKQPDSPPVGPNKKRISKRQRIESSSSEASTPKSSPVKKITITIEREDNDDIKELKKEKSPRKPSPPKSIKKESKTPKKATNNVQNGKAKSPEVNKNTKKVESKTKSPLLERNVKEESKNVRKDDNTLKTEIEGGNVPEEEYNPAKPKYDPIKDACWSKGQEVPYLALAKTLEAIEATSARLKIVEILSNYLRSVMALTPEDLLPSVYMCLNQLAPAYHSLELGIAETYLMKAVGQCTGRSLAQVKAALQKSGDLGLVAEQARSAQKTMFTPAPLKARKVFAALKEIANMTGQASVNKKIGKIQSLFVACRHSEARYLIRSLAGKLRIGLAEQSVLQALAAAAAQHEAGKLLTGDELKAKIDEYAIVIKTTYCECPNYDAIIPTLLENGALSLPVHCKLTPGVPLKPMLAHPTKGVHEVFNRFEGVEFTCEWKYDGERAQIHVPSAGGAADLTKAAVFSRNQENNTSKYPDILRRLPSLLSASVQDCVLDCEAVAYDVENKRILPFQILSTRKRKDATEADIKVQVCVFIFDLLYLNGKALVKEPLRVRRDLLRQHFKEVPGEWEYAKGQDCSTTEEVQSWLEESVQGSCEGLMVKTLDGPHATYEIARRSHNWLKLKKDYLDGVGDTIDAVVIGGYRGKGKRAGAYGGFLLACYDPDNEEYQSLCRVGTGFSDEDLTNFSEVLKEHVIEDARGYYRFDPSHAPDAWFAPAVVWEVRCADLSLSPSHRAAIALVEPDKGVSLRFPRFIRVRDDKSPEQATSAQQIAKLYLSQDQLKNQPVSNTAIDDFY